MTSPEISVELAIKIADNTSRMATLKKAIIKTAPGTRIRLLYEDALSVLYHQRDMLAKEAYSEKPKPPSFSVSIAMIGHRDVGLTNENYLMFRYKLNYLNMGYTTKTDIDNLCEYLQRLKIHLPEK
tara:strand:- start:103 stop:480 length:378 start_codon:yes stop_codon:yes gene_type:complete